MFNPLFGKRMKERRLKFGISQTEAARCCGMRRRRWSDLERGRRQPTPCEAEVIKRFLGFEKCFISPPAATKTLLARAASMDTTKRPFYPQQDRLTHIRYRSCLRTYSELTNSLLPLVLARDDIRISEHLCHKVSCESSLETLFILYLLSLGAVAGLRAPCLFGHNRWPIVDCQGIEEVGNRPRPCLVLGQTWYFFQVSFKASKVMRVDVLRWGGRWSIIELNGRGHDSRGDSTRGQELEMPITFWTEDQLAQDIRNSVGRRAS